MKFPQQEGTGIARLIPHASASCVELLTHLLAYNPDDRYIYLLHPAHIKVYISHKIKSYGHKIMLIQIRGKQHTKTILLCRFSARQALRHSYFKEIREKDKLQTFNNIIRMNSTQQPSPQCVHFSYWKQIFASKCNSRWLYKMLAKLCSSICLVCQWRNPHCLEIAA